MGDWHEGGLHRRRCNTSLCSHFGRDRHLNILDQSRSSSCSDVLRRCGRLGLRLLGLGSWLGRGIGCLLFGGIRRLRLGVLGRYLIVLEQSFEYLHALIFLLCFEKISNILYLKFDVLTLNLVFLAEDEARLNGLNLRFQ